MKTKKNINKALIIGAVLIIAALVIANMNEPELNLAKLTPGVKMDIFIGTGISPIDSTYEMYRCYNMEADGVDGSYSYSNPCGSETHLISNRAAEFPIFQNNMVEIAKSKYKFNPATDTITLNGKLIYPVSIPTPTPTVTATPTPTPTPAPDIQKPIITPPSIIRIFELIWASIKEFLGLASIAGGQTISSVVNQPYSTQIQLTFAPPDTNYQDGSYTAKFGEWFIVDANKNILKESGWSSELINSPYTITASFTPATPAKYYLIGVVVNQQYNYQNGAWTLTESIETKEVQEIVASLPNVPKAPPSTSNVGILASLSAWLKSIFSWLLW